MGKMSRENLIKLGLALRSDLGVRPDCKIIYFPIILSEVMIPRVKWVSSPNPRGDRPSMIPVPDDVSVQLKQYAIGSQSIYVGYSEELNVLCISEGEEYE